MKFLSTLIFFVAIGFTGYAQTDNSAMITDIYQRASKFYEDDKFADAVTLLERAETLSPNPDARILYLKIKALSSLYQNDASYGIALDKALPIFMSVAPAQNYPATKIQEVIGIQQQFVASQNLAKSNADQAVIVAKETKERLYEEQKKSLDAQLAEANKLMKRTGVGKRIFGLLFLGVCGLEVSSMANAEAGDLSAVKFTVALVSFGVGAVLLTSSSGRKRGKVLLKDVQQRQRLLQQRRLSFTPQLNIQPRANQYGVALRLRF